MLWERILGFSHTCLSDKYLISFLYACHKQRDGNETYIKMLFSPPDRDTALWDSKVREEGSFPL